MELTSNMFIENINSNSSEKILLKIKNGEWADIYKGLCNITNNSITMDYLYFKHFATKETYPIIQCMLTINIDSILLNND